MRRLTEIKKVPFSGRVFVLGCGAVSQCTVPLLVRHLELPPHRITVMDMEPRAERISDAVQAGVQFVRDQITPENFDSILSQHLGPGDLFVDLSWNVDTVTMLDWCHRRGVLFINTSVEEWDPYQTKDGPEKTLYHRQMNIRRLVGQWGGADAGPTAVLDHGANPGLVSHFTKCGLLEIATKIIAEKPQDARVPQLERAIADCDFALLSMLTGVKTIHISELDTQITSSPKRRNEFVNTWSVEGLYEEAIAPAELGWGTHERRIPYGAQGHKDGPRHQIFLANRRGMDTWVRSWVPGGQIHGMVIRHGEAFSIGEFLSVTDPKKNKVIYRPTVHYAYRPTDCAIASLQELRMRELQLQPEIRILSSDDLIEGEDILGVLLMGHDFGAWWYGSTLDVTATRELIGGQNPTTLQVASSLLGAIAWMIRNPNCGVNLPDYLPHDEILEVARPYIEPIISVQSDWKPVPQSFEGEWHEIWQFDKFLVSDTQIPTDELEWRDIDGADPLTTVRIEKRPEFSPTGYTRHRHDGTPFGGVPRR